MTQHQNKSCKSNYVSTSSSSLPSVSFASSKLKCLASRDVMSLSFRFDVDTESWLLCRGEQAMSTTLLYNKIALVNNKAEKLVAKTVVNKVAALALNE